MAEIIHRGSYTLTEWRNARQIEELPSSRQQTHQDRVRWQRPPNSFVKYNVDASFSEHYNRVGIGMCLRDEFGMFIGAKTIWLQPIMSVDIGEALRLQAAMEWVRELEFKKVICCLDSKGVVDSLNSQVRDDTKLGSILARCRVNLSGFCNNSYVEFSTREANMVAHELAKVAIYNASSHLYFDILDCIDPLIFNEMN